MHDGRKPHRPDQARRLRQRRYRQRQRSGKITAIVEIDAAILDLLVVRTAMPGSTGYLRECDSHDRKAIGAAIEKLLHDSAAD